MDRVPQRLISFPVAKRAPLESLPGFQRVVKSVERSLGEKGRVLVRYSGTENKARVLVEGPRQEKIDVYAEDLKNSLINELK